MPRRPPRNEPRRCSCDVNPDSHVYHGKKRRGTLSTHRGAKHLSSCRHSTLGDAVKPWKPRKIKVIPGTRKLMSIELAVDERGHTTA